jgi:hypothetical protein
VSVVILYFVPTQTSGCTVYSSLAPAPTQAEPVTIEQLKRPTGPVRRNIASTWVGGLPVRCTTRLPASWSLFTWNFRASGPVGFASPSMARGQYSFRFTRRGTCKLFCSLHPARMTQTVTVG